MIRTLLIYGAAAFLLNFFWESWHAVYLYANHEATSFADFAVKDYLSLILFVSFTDMMILLGVLIGGMFVWKNKFWFMAIDKGKLAYFLALTIGIAVLIEVKGVYLLHNWSYSELMPVIFGLGLSPLLQLAVTGLLSLWLVRNLGYGKNNHHNK